MTEYLIGTKPTRFYGDNFGGSGGGTWRGAQLYRSSVAVSFAAGVEFAAPFNTADFDTDNIRLAAPVTFGAVTVPTGAGGVCPAEMGGLWRIGGHVNAQWDSTDWVLVQYGFKVNNVKVPIFNTVFLGDPPGTTAGVMHDLTVPPFLVHLNEGDVVWFYVSSSIQIQIHGGDGTPLRNTWMLMEYLIPWALEDT